MTASGADVCPQPRQCLQRLAASSRGRGNIARRGSVLQARETVHQGNGAKVTGSALQRVGAGTSARDVPRLQIRAHTLPLAAGVAQEPACEVVERIPQVLAHLSQRGGVELISLHGEMLPPPGVATTLLHGAGGKTRFQLNGTQRW